MRSQLLHTGQNKAKFPSMPTGPTICSSASSFPFVIINLIFHSHEKCFWRVFLESILSSHKVSLSRNQIWWALLVSPRRLQMCCSALVHMLVKSCKYRGSKYNWGDGFRSKKWSLFMLGALRDYFAEIYKSGGRLWWKLRWVSSPHTCLDSMSCLSCCREWRSAATFAVRGRLTGLA